LPSSTPAALIAAAIALFVGVAITLTALTIACSAYPKEEVGTG